MKNQVQSIQNCFTSWECKWNVGLYFGAQETLFRGFADVDCGALFTARFKTTQDPRLHNLQKFITLLNRPSAVYMGCMWSPKWKNCKNMDLCQVEDCQPPASTWPPKGYTGLFSTLYGPLLDIYTPREAWKPCFFCSTASDPEGVGGSVGPVLQQVHPPSAWGRCCLPCFPLLLQLQLLMYYTIALLSVFTNPIVFISSVRSSLRNH